MKKECNWSLAPLYIGNAPLFEIDKSSMMAKVLDVHT